MLRLAADADVHGDVIRGLRLLLPDLDLVRVQDASLGSAEGPVILEWAAREGRSSSQLTETRWLALRDWRATRMSLHTCS
jgi:hypothetical protein